MRPKLTLLVVTMLAATLVLTGCNIFGWASGDSTESLIDEGHQHMRDAEYAEAAAKYEEALDKDPLSSEARYYHAKATMRSSGFDAMTLGLDLSDAAFETGDGLPFTGTAWPTEKADRLFQAIKVVYRDLAPIYLGQTEGPFKRDDIDLDYGLVAGIKGILFFRDTNLDGLITDDDYDLLFEFSYGSGFSIGNLPGFIQHASGSGKVAGPAAATPQPVPTEIVVAFNTLLDSVESIIAESHDIIVDILTEDLALDPEDIEEVLDEVVLMSRMYYINDGINNDPLNDSQIDEEVVNLLDDDGDGWIDEDSDGTYDLNP